MARFLVPSAGIMRVVEVNLFCKNSAIVASLDISKLTKQTPQIKEMHLCSWFETHFGMQVLSCSQFAGFCSNTWLITCPFELLDSQTDQVIKWSEVSAGHEAFGDSSWQVIIPIKASSAAPPTDRLPASK